MPSNIPELKTQPINTAEMAYLDYGGDGPTMILLHATGFLPWLWHPIALALADGYRVIAPAMFNHRHADPHQGGLGWLQLAQDLKQLCDRLGLMEITMIGHSMGAAVAALAHGVLGLPAGRMVLIEPIFLPQGLYQAQIRVDQHPLAAKAIKRRNHWRNREEARQDFTAKPFFQSWDDQILSLYIEHGLTDQNENGVRLTCTPQQEASLFMGGSQYDPWPVLPKVACPTLVVEGQISENRPWIDLKRVAELIPRGQYVEVAGSGHLIPMEKPAETIKTIQLFLESQCNI